MVVLKFLTGKTSPASGYCKLSNLPLLWSTTKVKIGVWSLPVLFKITTWATDPHQPEPLSVFFLFLLQHLAHRSSFWSVCRSGHWCSLSWSSVIVPCKFISRYNLVYFLFTIRLKAIIFPPNFANRNPCTGRMKRVELRPREMLHTFLLDFEISGTGGPLSLITMIVRESHLKPTNMVGLSRQKYKLQKPVNFALSTKNWVSHLQFCNINSI